MSDRYRVNAPEVIDEVIDGEAVIINLATGDYFSLRGTGSYIWQALGAGADTAAIVGAFVDTGLGEATEVTSAVSGLVEQLRAEGLIVAHDSDGPVPVCPPPPEASTFESPTLEKFTDMEDLILLDPVHEVDERGWPHVRSR